MSLVINLSALALIGLIIWWFWMSKPGAQKAGNSAIDIIVDNGVYSPARIEVESGKPVHLRFIRKDASPCAEKVIFEKLDIARDLPLNQTTEIKLNVSQPGEYPFTCQMKMYRGSLLVKK
jgi:plastocyanin domain-containing protein